MHLAVLHAAGVRVARVLMNCSMTVHLPCANVVLLQGHKGDINCVALSQDGRMLVSSGDDKTVRVRAVGTAYLLLSALPALVTDKCKQWFCYFVSMRRHANTVCE